VTAFIARCEPHLAALVTAARRALRAKFPGATELVYAKSNGLALGYSPTERPSDAFVSLAVYARGVNLYFLHGKHLPDPEGLLIGAGNQGRFIRLTDVNQLAMPIVEALLREAVKFGDEPLPKTGRGKAIIRAVPGPEPARRTGGRR
jgi:hypothetical protein